MCASQGTFYTAVLSNWPANLMCCNNKCFGKCHSCHVCHNVLFSLLLIQTHKKLPYNRYFLRQVAKYYCSNENQYVAKHKLHNCSPSVLSNHCSGLQDTRIPVLVATLIIPQNYLHVQRAHSKMCALFLSFFCFYFG